MQFSGLHTREEDDANRRRSTRREKRNQTERDTFPHAPLRFERLASRMVRVFGASDVLPCGSSGLDDFAKLKREQNMADSGVAF